MEAGTTSKRLLHGTTLHRAEAILAYGPDPHFREPEETHSEADGFSLALEIGPYLLGDPYNIARSKARNFPDEGGPVILEVEIPLELLALADDLKYEIRFDEEFGINELRAAWPTLRKQLKMLT